MDRFTVVGVLGFCCEPYWDSRNQRPSVALGKILSPLSSYSSSHHLEVCFVHTSGWCFYMQCWSLLIKLPDVFISSRVTNYITAVKRHPCQMFTQPASKARNRQKALLNPINQIFKSNVPEINQRNFLIDFLKINVIGSKSSIGF